MESTTDRRHAPTTRPCGLLAIVSLILLTACSAASAEDNKADKVYCERVLWRAEIWNERQPNASCKILKILIADDCLRRLPLAAMLYPHACKGQIPNVIPRRYGGEDCARIVSSARPVFG